jgi:hypothetical protein
MKRILILSFLLWPLAASAAEEQSNRWRLLQIAQPTFNTQNPDGTWSGGVGVSAVLCPGQPIIQTSFGFSKSKDKADVFKEISTKLDEVEKSAEELEAQCKK